MDWQVGIKKNVVIICNMLCKMLNCILSCSFFKYNKMYRLSTSACSARAFITFVFLILIGFDLSGQGQQQLSTNTNYVWRKNYFLSNQHVEAWSLDRLIHKCDTPHGCMIGHGHSPSVEPKFQLPTLTFYLDEYKGDFRFRILNFNGTQVDVDSSILNVKILTNKTELICNSITKVDDCYLISFHDYLSEQPRIQIQAVNPIIFLNKTIVFDR